MFVEFISTNCSKSMQTKYTGVSGDVPLMVQSIKTDLTPALGPLPHLIG